MSAVIFRTAKRPSFSEGVVVAIGLALVAAALVPITAIFVSGLFPIEIAVVTVTTLYVLYLIARGQHSVGRLVIAAIWLTTVTVALFAGFGLLFLALALGCGIWLARLIYFRHGFIDSLLDLMLVAIGGLAAVATLVHTSSFFLAVWVFLLCQAAHVTIPAITALRSRQVSSYGPQANHVDQTSKPTSDRFARALSAAESSLRRMQANETR